MYTDEDLNKAVEKGILTETSVAAFREYYAQAQQSPAVDEENFRLIGGFNDIFIVIASGLLLFSAAWLLKPMGAFWAYGVFAVLAWGLAEYFVRKRKMALPAILLLCAFLGGIYTAVADLFAFVDWAYAIAAAVTAVAAYGHWRRFNVPITVALGVAAACAFVVFLLLAIFEDVEDFGGGILLPLVFGCGIAAFFVAMKWDAADTARLTRKADVAFWMHLLAAPLIVHPVFASLGVLGGEGEIANMIAIIILYALMTVISLVVDRRVFMVSSLAYVIFAFGSLINTYGGVVYSFALTGVFMGGALLLLSAYWQIMRAKLVNRLPQKIMAYVPAVK